MRYLTPEQRELKRAWDRAYQAKRRAMLKKTNIVAPLSNLGKNAAKKTATSKDATNLVNHIALVIDSSGSMQSLRAETVSQINKQINTIKENAYKTKQKTFVSVYTFSDRCSLRCLVGNAFPEAVPQYELGSFIPRGQTALLDAVLDVGQKLENMDDGAKTTSFLMVVLTDGQENASSASSWGVKSKLAKLQGTDRWTFAFLMPPGGKKYALSLGIPEGNIQEWEGTEVGLRAASQSTQVGTSNYYTSRSAGATKSTSFFTDLSSIGKRDLNKLTDLTGQFKRWTVKKECAISDFVVDEHKRTYIIGNAFYQITKPEKVQAYKELIIEDRSTGILYGGTEARKLIGITAQPGEVFRVTPGNHANFNLFVQSTSMNRKLVRGTVLLYRI
jgi:hypothetical protein